MKILFLAYSNRDWPSSRIRAWDIADNWIEADCYLWSDYKHLDLNIYDYIVLQKLPLPHILPLAKEHKVFLDLNDPEWWLRETKTLITEYLPHLQGVIVSSEGLKKDFEETFDHPAIWIDDRQPFAQGFRTHEPVEQPTLVWFGSTGNRAPCLNPIGETFHRLLAEDINFKLLIIDGEPNTQYINEPWCFHMPWTRGIHSWLCNADIALLPDYPGPWGPMKSMNKQYTAHWAGLPVSKGIDYFRLKKLILDYQYRVKIGRENRRTAELFHEVETSVAAWQELTYDTSLCHSS